MGGDRISLRKLLFDRTSGTGNQAFRYIVSGGTAFAVDFLLLKLCTDHFGLHYLLSAVIGYTAGLIITYTLSIRWVFDRRKLGRPWAEFLIFAAIGVVGLGLTTLFMWLFTGIVGVHYEFSKILTTVIVTGWNFTAKKIILF